MCNDIVAMAFSAARLVVVVVGVVWHLAVEIYLVMAAGPLTR